MKPTIITPNPKHVTDDNFIKWYDQKTFGSKEGSLGMKRGTESRGFSLNNFQEDLKFFSFIPYKSYLIR